MTLAEIIIGERREIERDGQGSFRQNPGLYRGSGADVGEMLIMAHVAVRCPMAGQIGVRDHGLAELQGTLAAFF